MKLSSTTVTLSIQCLLTRAAFVLAFSASRSYGQKYTIQNFHTYMDQGRKQYLLTPSFSRSRHSPSHDRTTTSISLPFLASLRAGSASSEAEPSLSSSSINLIEEIEALADECQKQGISSGLEIFWFGDHKYTFSSSLQSGRNKHRVIFILGGPGAGKGTQCENIISTYNCIHHLSVGELLRNVPKDSPHAELVEQCLVAGKIVPVEISLSLLRDAMDKATKDDSNDNGDSSTTPVFLVDGFPRNFDSLSGWIQSMPEYADVLGALVFDCSIEELEKRILDRGKTSGRSDDNLTSARKRFGTFQEQTVPVIKVFETLERRGEGLKVIRIAGEKSVEEVWADTQAAMDEYLLGDILSSNSKLLDAIEKKDLDAYLSLCDVKMLTSGKDDMLVDENGENTTAKLFEAFKSLEVIEDMGEMKQLNQINNVEIEFHDGALATVSYDRTIRLDNENILSNLHETRVWKQGEKGWRNVHFIRS